MVKYYLETLSTCKTSISLSDYFYLKSLLDRRNCPCTCFVFSDKKRGLLGRTYNYDDDGRFVKLSFMIFNDGVFN